MNELERIDGTASRTSPATVASVEVQIQRDSDNKYWDGNSWETGEQWDDASARDGAFDESSENWRYTDEPDWANGVEYTVRARAVDNYGSEDTTPATATFTFDSTEPETTMDDIDDSVDELDEITGSASDPSPSLASVEVLIKDVDSGDYWDDEDEDWTSSETWNEAEADDGTFNEEDEDWTYENVPEWEDGTEYEVEARAVDKAGNEDETPAEDSFTFEIELTLDEITWNDVDDSDTINRDDKLTFKFSKPVDTETLDTEEKINERLDSTADGDTDYGPSFKFRWNTDDDELTVTLGKGETIKGEETVNPKATVKDKDGNSDATSGSGAEIPEASGTESAWQWWHFLLIGLAALIVVYIIIRLIRRSGRAPGLEEEDLDEFGEGDNEFV